MLLFPFCEALVPAQIFYSRLRPPALQYPGPVRRRCKPLQAAYKATRYKGQLILQAVAHAHHKTVIWGRHTCLLEGLYIYQADVLVLTDSGQGNYTLKVDIDALYSSSYELHDELRHSRRGHIYGTWKKVLPRISDRALNCVIYLYPSVEEAENGQAGGGTGFLVGFRSEVHKDKGYIYAVTNSHVIREGGAAAPVVRLNTKQGETDVLDLSLDNWVHHQDGEDLAICVLQVDPDAHHYTTISPENFITKELIERHDIGPGDEVYMVGRFINHEGRQRNIPTARFGNISMMPWEPIKNPFRGDQESFLVETRSLGGYSGSPVFVHILSYAARAGKEGYHLPERAVGPWLLGVDWGHLPITEEVKPKKSDEKLEEKLVVESNSGQMGVVPAWRLRELLYQEDIAEMRKRWDDQITKTKESSSFILDAQRGHVEEPEKTDEGLYRLTEDDFENAIDRVSRREPPSDPES